MKTCNKSVFQVGRRAIYQIVAQKTLNSKIIMAVIFEVPFTSAVAKNCKNSKTTTKIQYGDALFARKTTFVILSFVYFWTLFFEVF